MKIVFRLQLQLFAQLEHIDLLQGTKEWRKDTRDLRIWPDWLTASWNLAPIARYLQHVSSQLGLVLGWNAAGAEASGQLPRLPPLRVWSLLVLLI
jgi:hypothetical protein